MKANVRPLQLLLLPALLLSSSCATYTPPPEGASSATVRFVGDHSEVFIYTTPSCQARQSVMKESWDALRVRAGQRTWIQQSSGANPLATHFGVPACGFAYSFHPERGATYGSEYSLKGDRCRLALYRVTESGEKVPEPSARPERPLNCFP